MAERNPRIAHSIESLLFVNRNGKYCGYKQELISENIGAEWKEFLICAECEGISRRARQGGGNTVCEMCVPEERIVPEVLLVDINPIPVQYYGDIDKRVENKVASLNARCPLSGEGCSWEGKLKEIEKHMEECEKVRVECQLECGNVLERESVEQHNREICPLRIIQCIYCNQEMQAKEENPHLGQCQYNPNTEVPCPYKELGCEAIVLRKNMNTHITVNITDHHTLMVYQLNQLRNRNKQLERVNEEQRDMNEEQRDTNQQLERVYRRQRNKNQQQEQVYQEQRNMITTIETSATNRERKHAMERKKENERNWIIGIITMVTVTVSIIIAATIGITVAVALANNIKTNSEQIASNLNQTKFNSSETEQLIESHFQLIESLLSNTSYIYKFIEERGKALLGIEWIYNLTETGNLYGLTFYLGQCKLRLTAVAEATNKPNYEMFIEYRVERVEGKYNDSVVSCAIIYTYTTLWYLGDTQPEDTYSYNWNTDLSVGGSMPISQNFWKYAEGKGIVRFYFDTAGD